MNERESSDVLSLDAAWSISEASFAYISRLIKEPGYQTMVEFGSGISTARWLLAFPELQITSIEHDQQFYRETQQQLIESGLQERVQLLYAPLRRYWFHGRRFYSYSQPVLPQSCDVVIIDGPPFFTRRGREACLYYVYDALKTGGIVVLDDARREDEQASVANWLSVYPGSFSYSFVDVGNGLAILQKNQHVTYRVSRRALIDYYALTYRQSLFSIKVFLKTRWQNKTTVKNKQPDA